MNSHFNNQRHPPGKGAPTLFGGPLAEPVGHLSARYPYPARLNAKHVAQLKASNHATSFPAGAILYQEGEKPAGVYVVFDGRVKLSVNSAQGRTLVLGVFGPGTILGLAAAVLERTHAATAETLQPTQVLLVPREEFAREIENDPLAARQTAALLSEACFFILTKLKAVDLSESAQQKLARCLLGLLGNDAPAVDCAEEEPLRLDLNQETVAQMVGLSRETVSRLLSRFRSKGILDWKRSGIVIRDRKALERLADFPEAPSRSGEDNG